MLRTVSTLTLGLLVLSGCPGDDSGTTAGSAGTSTGAGTSEPATESSQPQTTSGESADTTAGGPGTTTDTPGTTTDTPGTTTDTPGTTTDEPGTSSGGMDVCAMDPADDECAACVKDMCCPQLQACDAVPECACFQECVQDAGPLGVGQCTSDCNAQGVAEVQGLIDCSSGNCLASCI